MAACCSPTRKPSSNCKPSTAGHAARRTGVGETCPLNRCPRFAAQQFFGAVFAWFQQQRTQKLPAGATPPAAGTLRVRKPLPVPDSLSEELKKLGSELDGIAEKIDTDEEKIELTAAADRCH